MPSASPTDDIAPEAWSRSLPVSFRQAATSSRLTGDASRFCSASTTASSCPVAPVTTTFASTLAGSMPL
jgi:hypothetical protein